jgi:hypothetical protein
VGKARERWQLVLIDRLLAGDHGLARRHFPGSSLRLSNYAAQAAGKQSFRFFRSRSESADTAIFSVLDAFLLRSLRVKDPHRLCCSVAESKIAAIR